MKIVLVSIDCLRADRVSYAGYEKDTTPFLDSLASNGYSFKQAYATGPTTTQSMPGLMTGCYPSFFGGYPPIPDSRATLADALRSEGFKTVGIHSNPWLDDIHNFDKGFEEYIDISTEIYDPSGETDRERSSAPASGLGGIKRHVFEAMKSKYYGLPASARRIMSQGYFFYYYLFDKAKNTAEKAIKIARKALSKYDDNDLFLWIHFMDVHRPYTLPSDRIHGNLLKTAKITQPAYTEPDKSEEMFISDLYDSAVSYVDTQLEKFHQHVKNRISDDDTLFVITSDHGEEFGEHGDFFHRNFKLYDSLLHVPLVVWGNSIPKGSTSELVSLSDVAPTILNHVEASIPRTMSGQSFNRVFDGAGFQGNETVAAEVYDPDRNKVAIRSKDWKLIKDMESDKRELYNVSEGFEDQNLINKRQVPEKIQQQLEAFLDQRNEYNKNGKYSLSVENQLKGLGYLE